MSDSGASPSAAGYGYQYERALYRIFTAPSAHTKFGIETADDVEEISKLPTGTHRVSEQAKLSVKPRKNPLRDSSENLWKTLRNWLSKLAESRQKYDELEYLLVTNKVIKKGTLAIQLSDASSKTEVEEAVAALRTHASGMTGKPGEIAQEVIAYSDSDLAFLIEHMHIEDGQLNAQMKQRVISSLHLPEDAAASSETIYQGLVGFLFDQCQEKWITRQPFWTTAQTYYNKRQALVEAFMSAPWEPLPFEEIGFAEWAQNINPADMLFVGQLEKLNMPRDLLMQQFGFFCAAYLERIRLLESGRVLPNDFERAERVLGDRWQSLNSAYRLRKMKLINQFEITDYNEIMIQTLFPESFPMKVGRMNSNAQYLFSGTYHRMANRADTKSPIYWHRESSEFED